MIKKIAPILVTLAMLFLLSQMINRETIWLVLEHGRGSMMALAVLPLFFAHLLSAWRWKSILELTGVEIEFRKILQIYGANLPLAKWSPLYAGDMFRAVYLRNKIDIRSGMAVITAESIIDVATLLFIVLMSAVAIGKLLYVALAVFGLVSLVVLSSLLRLSFFKRIERFSTYIFAFDRAIKHLRGSPRRTCAIVGITALSWMQISLFVYLMTKAFQIDIPLLSVLMIQPIITLLSLVPVTLGGLGTREASMVILYSPFASPDPIFLIAFSYSILSLVFFPLVGACIGFRELFGFFKRNEQESRV